MIKNLEEYHELTKDLVNLPIYLKSWYLKSVCTEGDFKALVYNNEFGSSYLLPIYIKSKFGLKYAPMPNLCKWLGPVPLNTILPNSKHPITKKIKFLEQNFYYNSHYNLPKEFSGVDQIKCHSYQIDLRQQIEDIYGNINSGYRNNKLPKAENLILKISKDHKIICDLQFMSYGYSNFSPPFSKEFLLAHVKSIIYNNSGMVLSLHDRFGKPYAAAFLIWDTDKAYFHLAGMDPNYKKSSASIRIIWECIQYSKEILRKNIFDFEGSMIPRLERVRKNFGASKVYYSKVKYFNNDFIGKAIKFKNRFKSP